MTNVLDEPVVSAGTVLGIVTPSTIWAGHSEDNMFTEAIDIHRCNDHHDPAVESCCQIG